MRFHTLILFLCLCFVLNYTNAEPNKDINKNVYEQIPETEYFYKLHKTQKPFEDAKSICENEGASLFYADTENEVKNVMKFFHNKYKEALPTQLLLGLKKSENDFVTIDGISISKVYVNWYPNEPNNPTTEHCVILMHPALNMNNVPCSLSYSFICKLQRNVSDDQCHILSNSDYGYSEETGSCYKFHLTPKTWAEAQAACRYEESHLAVINSHEEAAYLVRLTHKVLAKIPGRFSRGVVLLGFHNNDVEDWQTIEDTSLYYSGYACWGNNQPDGGEQDRCGSMFYNGHLNDIACDQKAFFICEHKNPELNYVYEPRSFYNVIQGISLYYSGYACWGNQPDGGERDRCGSMFYNGHLNDIACDQKAFSFANSQMKKQCHDTIE